METWDVVVIGAGAAGMMCAVEAGRRGRRVLVLDHARAPGEKIRISGGGRCNFTNIHTAPDRFLSDNPRFCISALSRFTAKDFIARVDARGIAWHEKTLGQLFCDGSARQIVELLTDDMRAAGVTLRLGASAEAVERAGEGFALTVGGKPMRAAALVLASGGKSIPKMGATGFAYELAARFGLRVTPTRPALVPLTFGPQLLERTALLAGVSTNATAACGKRRFEEALLFTHRGLSGPAILQISSYWKEGDELLIDLAPGSDVAAALAAARRSNGRLLPQTVLGEALPKRLALAVVEAEGAAGKTLGDLPGATMKGLATSVNAWRVKPTGSEGYRTAEVTLGGVDTRDLDSRTLQAREVPGLFFIGEAVDVTGWLGGYNFQWAWASGWAAGQAA